MSTELKAVVAAHARHQWTLMNYPNVIASGVGYTRQGGEKTDQYCVKVYVTCKMPVEELAPAAVLPKFIYSDDNGTARVDVEQMEIPTAPPMNVAPLDATPGKPDVINLKSRYRPVLGGISTASYRFPVGTLSIPVEDCYRPNQRCILSNNHVLAFLNGGRYGDPILQPAYGNGGVYPVDQIGTLTRFIPLRFGGPPNQVDAAIADIPSGSSVQDVELVGPIASSKPKSEVMVGDNVHKVGCVSGLTSGSIEAINASVWINYAVAGFGNTPALFTDQILTGHMAMYGDSGSLLLDNDNRAIGLLCAGSTTHTVYNFMTNVQDALGIAFTS